MFGPRSVAIADHPLHRSDPGFLEGRRNSEHFWNFQNSLHLFNFSKIHKDPNFRSLLLPGPRSRARLWNSWSGRPVGEGGGTQHKYLLICSHTKMYSLYFSLDIFRVFVGGISGVYFIILLTLQTRLGSLECQNRLPAMDDSRPTSTPPLGQSPTNHHHNRSTTQSLDGNRELFSLFDWAMDGDAQYPCTSCDCYLNYAQQSKVVSSAADDDCPTLCFTRPLYFTLLLSKLT